MQGNRRTVGSCRGEGQCVVMGLCEGLMHVIKTLLPLSAGNVFLFQGFYCLFSSFPPSFPF
jgi:hypothetical protein